MSLEELQTPLAGVGAAVLRRAPAALLVVSTDGTVMGLNPAAARLLGDQRTPLVGCFLPACFASGDDSVVSAFLERVARAGPGERHYAEARLVRADGLQRNLELLGATLLDEAIEDAIVLHLVDVTRYVRAIRDPAALATIATLQDELRTDYLTGVGNARALDEHLRFTHEEARRTGTAYVVAFVDGDQFGAINKQYGQDAGDAAVRAMAQGLAREVRVGDRVFRRGGDEFVVVLRETTIGGAQGWLERVRDALAGLDGQAPIRFTISAGLAASDQDGVGDDARQVMARADDAMQQAKAIGGDQVMVA